MEESRNNVLDNLSSSCWLLFVIPHIFCVLFCKETKSNQTFDQTRWNQNLTIYSNATDAKINFIVLNLCSFIQIEW